MKIKIIFLFFIVFYIAIVAKLFILQVIHSPTNKSPYLKTTQINPVRGKIFDKNSQPLALNQNSYQLYLEPKKINDKELISNVYAILSKISFEANKYKMAHNKLIEIVNENKDSFF